MKKKQGFLSSVTREFNQLTKDFGGQILPCSQEEIDDLEALVDSQYKLPSSYKEFLLYGGHKMGSFFRFVNLSYKSTRILIENHYEDIIEILDANGVENTSIPSNIFIISEYLAAYFLYFRLDEGDDPPIYFWKEGKGGLENCQKEADSFSEFLLEQIHKYKASFRGEGTL